MASSGLRLSEEEERGWERIVRPLAEASAGMERSWAVAVAAEDHERIPLASGLFDSTVASAETGLADIVTRVAEGRDPNEYRLAPEAIAYMQDIAREGHPIEVLFQIGHVGQAFLLRNWRVFLYERARDHELILGAVGYCQQFTLAWIEQLCRQWKEIYLAERGRSVDVSEALRAAAVRRLLTGADAPHDLDAAGREIRFDLSGPLRAFVLWADRPRSDLRNVLRRHANVVARVLSDGEALLIPWGEDLVAGWAPDGGPLPRAKLRALLASQPGVTTRVAFGSVQAGIEGFRRSHEEALEARRVARLSARPGPVHEYRTLALTALATSDLNQARRFVAEELGPLAGQDDATVRIAATLRVWFEEMGNTIQTARRLGIHKNTVLYRVQRAEQLLGRPVNERALELQLALALARTLTD
ncbi:MAG: helix-turn-helix domain-containing protein [Actinomycetota bacterium]